MMLGMKRTFIARVAAALGFVCGVIGLSAGLADQEWRLGAIGWFTGGGLLVLIAMYVLTDGAFAFRRTQVMVAQAEAILRH